MAEEVFLHQGRCHFMPPAFIDLSLAEPFYVVSGVCMHSLSSVERGSQHFMLVFGTGLLVPIFPVSL